jgi:DHA1 family inner membrane transport protein
MPLSLLVLAIAAFGIGTTEFVIVGLLPSVARDLGVTIPQAGYLVSGYALGVVVGAPIVAILTSRLPRKPALLGTIAVITVLLLFRYTSHSHVAAVVTIFIWGTPAFALVPLLQMRIVDKAAAAPNLASTLNQGALNLGNAGGAWLGGASLGIGIGYESLPRVGAAVAVLALVATVFSESLERHGHLGRFAAPGRRMRDRMTANVGN